MAASAHAQDDGFSVSVSVSVSSTDASQADPGIPAGNPGIPQADPGNSSANEPGATSDPDISWKHFPVRVLEDQKELWLFPTQLARGRHWVPTLVIVGVTAGLIAADPHDEPYFRRTTAFDGISKVLSTTNTEIAEIGFPVAVYVTGLLRHDSYTEQTAMLAGEAYLDSAIPEVVIKLVSRRLRPANVAPNQNFSDTFFQSRVGVLGNGSSFPSGHAIGAFSIGTVIARRYANHKWVPWAAYGVAGLISLSRISDLSHFPSDVFLGAALGYTITRFDVFRDR